MEQIINYENKCAEIRQQIKKDADSAWNEIVAEAQKETDKNERDAKEYNEAPCSVCKKTEYVLKYRDVEGSIHGETYGYFSLFGGSISGYIDGETHTNPVLSCRNCGNEKKVEIASYKSDYELLKEQLPTMWGGTFTDNPCSKWLSEKGLEVARLLMEHTFLVKDYNDIREFPDSTLIKCGLDYKYKFPKKPSFYWFKKKFL